MNKYQCPFRFRCGKRFYCSVKKGNFKHKQVFLKECRLCDHREALNAV